MFYSEVALHFIPEIAFTGSKPRILQLDPLITLPALLLNSRKLGSKVDSSLGLFRGQHPKPVGQREFTYSTKIIAKVPEGFVAIQTA